MSACLVTIMKSYAGETWENTWCVGLGTDFTVKPSDADLTTLGAGLAFTTTNTAGTAGPDFLHRLVAFERGLLPAAMTIARVYVTDGKRNRLGGTEYWVSSPNIPGAANNPADMNTILPGSIALVINKNPSNFSTRPGRAYIRGLLLDTDVIFAGKKLVAFTSGTVASTYGTIVGNVLAGTALNTHLFGGTNSANGVLLIPKFRRTTPIPPPPPNQEGELINGSPVASITVGVPTTRQAARGRRRRRA